MVTTGNGSLCYRTSNDKWELTMVCGGIVIFVGLRDAKERELVASRKQARCCQPGVIVNLEVLVLQILNPLQQKAKL